MKYPLLLILPILFTLCRSKTETSFVLYHNGDIITMQADSLEYVEALVCKNESIVFVGSFNEAERIARHGYLEINLEGKTLLPGFIDPHSHALLGSYFLRQANLFNEPIGQVEDISDLIAELKNHLNKHPLKNGDWLIGNGYDNEMLKELRHPTVTDLDNEFPDIPVMLIHASGHMVVLNSQALKAANISKVTPSPEGGVIQKNAMGSLTGLLQENAIYLLAPHMPKRDVNEKVNLLHQTLKVYAANGITTASEGLTDPGGIEVLKNAAQDSALLIDVVSLPSYVYLEKVLSDTSIQFLKYKHGLKFGGIKITGDGSPQGKTAFFTKPYSCNVKDGCDPQFRGVPSIRMEVLDSVMHKVYQKGYPIFMHCNGDATVDMLIAAQEKYFDIAKAKKIRSVVVHAQFSRQDQLTKYKALDLIPSFFSNHAYYWGDIHRKNLGEERAKYLSPMKDAHDMDLVFTNHTDYTVTSLDQMFLLWTAVNRLTRTGYVLGEQQRISPYHGLRAITYNAAYQYGEEKTKGSLEVGKLADLVILDKNPLKVEPSDIRNIKVVATVKGGKNIYKRLMSEALPKK